MSDSSAGAGHRLEPPQRRRNILVVEDNRTDRMQLRAELHEAGFAVMACETKASAAAALHARRFDLAILDVLLPDGTGIELLWELRGLYGSTERVPVILLSAEAEARQHAQGLLPDADAYIRKPYDPYSLLECVRKLLQSEVAASRVEPASRAEPASRTEPASRAEPASKSEAMQGGAWRILLVDDSASFRQRLGDALQIEGHRVFPAASGEDALLLLNTESVDIVLLDLRMPGIGGLETCRIIHEDHRHRQTHIMVMVGGSEGHEMRALVMEAGASTIITRDPQIRLICDHVRGALPPRGQGGSDRPSSKP